MALHQPISHHSRNVDTKRLDMDGMFHPHKCLVSLGCWVCQDDFHLSACWEWWHQYIWPYKKQDCVDKVWIRWSQVVVDLHSCNAAMGTNRQGRDHTDHPSILRLIEEGFPLSGSSGSSRCHANCRQLPWPHGPPAARHDWKTSPSDLCTFKTWTKDNCGKMRQMNMEKTTIWKHHITKQFGLSINGQSVAFVAFAFQDNDPKAPSWQDGDYLLPFDSPLLRHGKGCHLSLHSKMMQNRGNSEEFMLARAQIKCNNC